MVRRDTGVAGKFHALRARTQNWLLKRRLTRQWKASGGSLVADHGWIKLLYSNDGDAQELRYHGHCLEDYRHDMAIFRDLVHPGDVVLDVGANLGFVSVMFAQLVQPGGHVFSFEPSPHTYAKLVKTVELNGLRDVVTPLNLGCGSAASTAWLKRVSRSSGNDSIVNAQGTDSEVIHIDTLDALSQRYFPKVDLIKIDTEGYEPEVLLGARELIARCRPVVYLEMGGEYLASTQRSLEILEEYGYDLDLPAGLDWTQVANGSNFVARPRRFAESVAQ